jgi:ribosomal protein S18 acetylase RimI-like enzyme
MTVRSYEHDDLNGLADIWNETFVGGPNSVRITEGDLRRRVVDQPSFDPAGILVAARGAEVKGFVHFGPRANLWSRVGQRRINRLEGHIYALAAGREAGPVALDLLKASVERLAAAGAHRVLLGPSWVHGTQPFYNGIAGAYEIPGLSQTRRDIIELAADNGFAPMADYGTPELDLTDATHLSALRSEAARILADAAGWDLRERSRTVSSSFFPTRVLVELERGTETIAAAAYGPWPEYTRQYGRRAFGITNVHVSPEWRGKGLGKLIMLLAIEAAANDGADALHLHVWRANKAAWHLYHEALAFRPAFTWVTLVKQLRSPSR